MELPFQNHTRVKTRIDEHFRLDQIYSVNHLALFVMPETKTATGVNYKCHKNLPIHALYHRSAFISSPEHEVLMVSYCGQSMSVVRRPSCSVRRQQLL